MDKRFAYTIPLAERHPLIQWAYARGIMLKEVCAAVGISRPTLHHWDKGHCMPSAEHMGRIMEYTKDGVTLDAVYLHWQSKQQGEAA